MAPILYVCVRARVPVAVEAKGTQPRTHPRPPTTTTIGPEKETTANTQHHLVFFLLLLVVSFSLCALAHSATTIDDRHLNRLGYLGPLPFKMTTCAPDDDDPQWRVTPIDILPDDILVYLVGTYLDDRSLGACLLAWRRFHVLDRHALYRRKYRWATLACLCVAGDRDGLDYALDRPDVFGTLDTYTWLNCIIAAGSAGHIHTIERMATMPGMPWPLHFNMWVELLFDLARCDHSDGLAWLCRADNRPCGWDDALLASNCADAMRDAKHDAATVIERVFGAIEAAGESRGAQQHQTWRLVAAKCRDHPPQPRPPSKAAVLVEAVREIFCLDGQEEACFTDVENVNALVDQGHVGLLRDLVGTDRLAACLRHIDSRPPDPDEALWVYDLVDRPNNNRQPKCLFDLLDVAARTGRLDLLDRVESDLALLSSPYKGRAKRAFERACEMAVASGHALFVDRILAHRLAADAKRCSFGGPALSGFRSVSTSPPFIHHEQSDLVRVLLDRRPRPGIPQADVDARVDGMIAAAVEDASRAGNLAAVRWLYSLAPAVVEDRILRLRGHRRRANVHADCTETVIVHLGDPKDADAAVDI
ncbi:hypothetical protein pclt_cds_941 [Pandoravirus celtis]|uniref:F-box domain containing protein n=1 Tax=Pandoravirus celtis TaxID=2568002 RepID=A0A4D6EII1_9VIRU|nr:hypothetical protein pclt_cds_941 [Pandoravirus celtis]